jgi:multidrug efflux pump
MMLLFGFSINTLTLLSLVLAIGLVVDDAIVMLENIYRYIEEGMPPVEAALKGSREIAFAVIAMTVTLAAVYAPVSFMEGRTGRLFTEFALTLAGAVLISGFVALTLSPMMCSRLLRKERAARHGSFFMAVERGLARVQTGYARWLDFALTHPRRVLLTGLVVALAGGIIAFLLPSELAPVEDRGTIFVIGIAPEGSTIQYTTRWMARTEAFFKEIPEIEKYYVIGGFPTVSQGAAFVRLKDWSERNRSQQAIVGALQPQLFGGIPGIMAFPVNPPSLGRSPINKPVEFVIQTTGTYAELDAITNKFLAELARNPRIVGVDSDLKLNKPELRVRVDRDKAATSGVDVETIGRTLETMLGGRQVTRFKRKGEEYDVIVQIEDARRTNPTDISDIYVRGTGGGMIQLANILSLQETVAPRELNHFNQMRAVKITANLVPGYTLGEALTFMRQAAERVLPASALVEYDGESREFLESSSSLLVTFALALAFIYLVLAAQFESFRSPLLIMMTVPLSMTGALLLLWLGGGSLSIYSQIGLITLIGLITKHGILLVEFASQRLEQGKPAREAAREAALLRLRPILMTTGAMVLGAVPLAFATGAGAESRAQIGQVIIGGMMIGTFFTLFVIPVLCSLTLRARGGAPASSRKQE